MAINEIVKDALKTHKSKIELTQWAVIHGVASLVYSEYLYNMKNKVTPGKTLLMVPKISALRELLDENGEFIEWISEHLIDSMIEDELFIKFINAPELEMFRGNNIEVMKTILDLYIIPNISRSIPDTIMRKFAIGDPKNQSIIESNEIDLFERKSVSDEYMRFISHEIVLQLLTLLPTMKKDVEIPELNSKFQMSEKEILVIKNTNSICPVIIDKSIIENDVMKLLSFVTNTTVDILTKGDVIGFKSNGLSIDYIVASGPFNNVSLINLIGEYDT